MNRVHSQGELHNFMMGPAIDVTVNRNYIYQDAFDQLTEDKGNTSHLQRVLTSYFSILPFLPPEKWAIFPLYFPMFLFVCLFFHTKTLTFPVFVTSLVIARVAIISLVFLSE